MGSPILNKVIICSSVILRLKVYKDAKPKQTGPEILNAIAFLIFVSNLK
jgi:hypothetical protein